MERFWGIFSLLVYSIVRECLTFTKLKSYQRISSKFTKWGRRDQNVRSSPNIEEDNQQSGDPVVPARESQVLNLQAPRNTPSLSRQFSETTGLLVAFHWLLSLVLCLPFNPVLLFLLLFNKPPVNKSISWTSHSTTLLSHHSSISPCGHVNDFNNFFIINCPPKQFNSHSIWESADSSGNQCQVRRCFIQSQSQVFCEQLHHYRNLRQFSFNL